MATYYPDAPKKVRVTIFTVDPRTRRVEARLKDGIPIALAVWETPPFFRWPREGEEWTAIYESNFWRLGEYVGGEKDTFIEGLMPGEGRIDSDKLYISGETFVLGEAVVLDNDPRFDAPSYPSGPAGGVLSGAYPNPGFAVDMATQIELDAAVLAGSAAAVILAPATSARNVIQPSSAAVVPSIVKGALGQTANLQEWKNSVGANRVIVDSTGVLSAYYGMYGGGVSVGALGWGDITIPGAPLRLYGATSIIARKRIEIGTTGEIAASEAPLIVKGAASQTASLQEWQNSAGTVQAAVKPDGGIDVLTAGKGLKLKSPDGLVTKTLTIDNTGVLVGYPSSTDPRLSDQRVPVDGSVTLAKLSFDPATQTELDAHTNLTTTAHGGIVASTDPRLSDQRVPTDGSVTITKLAFDPATQVELNAHTALTTTAHGGIVASTDPRLSDQRVPVDGSVTITKLSFDPATQTELDTHTALTTGAHNLTALLGAKADLIGGVIPTSQIPAVATGQTVTVADQAAMLALTSAQVQPGDVAIRTDLVGRRFLLAGNPSVLGDWIGLETPDAVSSVNGQQGVVVLGKSDVGLGLADNTSDINKPISTATQTVLDLKANSASPTLTGVPVAPTAAINTNTTQLATTAFVLGQTASRQPIDATLTALASFNSNGALHQTAVDTFVARTLTGDTEIVVANGNGVSGNPTLSVGATVARLASPAFTGTPTIPTAAFGTNTTQAASTAFVAANSALVKIGDFSLVGTTILRYDNIPQTYSHLRVVAKMQSTRAGFTNTGGRFQFNTDVNNYVFNFSGGTLTQGNGYLGNMPAGNKASNDYATQIIIDIPYYTLASSLKVALAQSIGHDGTNFLVERVSNARGPMGAITRLDLFDDVLSALGPNASATLYGIRA